MPINGPRPRPGGPGEVNLGMYHDRPREGVGYAGGGGGEMPNFEQFWNATGRKMFGTPAVHMARGGPVKNRNTDERQPKLSDWGGHQVLPPPDTGYGGSMSSWGGHQSLARGGPVRYDQYGAPIREEDDVSPSSAPTWSPEQRSMAMYELGGAQGYANGGTVADDFYAPDPAEEGDLQRRKYALQREMIAAKQAELARKAAADREADIRKQLSDNFFEGPRPKTEVATQPLKPNEYIGPQGETRTGRNTAVAPAMQSAAPALPRIDDEVYEDPPAPANTQAATGARTGYADAGVPTQPDISGYRPVQGGTLDKVMDYIHSAFGIGSARGADNPPPPPATGYAGTGAGGYGGELTSPPPTARGSGSPDEVTAKPIGAPLSLQSPAPPSISGQDTPRVAALPESSKLAQVQREQEEYRKANPVSERSIPGMVLDLPRAWGDAARRADASAEMFEGTDNFLQRGWKSLRQGLEGMVGGDHPKTPAETLKVLDTIAQNPQADHNMTVQRTFDELGKTGGVDAQANFVQSLRPSYDKYMGIALAAISQGRLDMAQKFIEQAHNLLPNGMKLNVGIADKGGGLIATVRPEGGGTGGYSVRMTPQQLYDYATGPASQFDHVAKNGIEANLKKLTGVDQAAGASRVQGPPPLEPGQIRPSGPGGVVLSGPGGVPRSEDRMGGAGAPGMADLPPTPVSAEFDPNQRSGQRTRPPSYTERPNRPGFVDYAPGEPRAGATEPGLKGKFRYDVAGNIGESERPGLTDTQAGREGVERIIANTGRTAAAAAQNRGPKGEVLDPTAPARSLTSQDPRSIANRDDFARRVTRQPAEGPRPLTQDEQLAVNRTAPADAAMDPTAAGRSLATTDPHSTTYQPAAAAPAAAAPAEQQQAPLPVPPSSAVQALRADPKLLPQFVAKYGRAAAERILRGQ